VLTKVAHQKSNGIDVAAALARRNELDVLAKEDETTTTPSAPDFNEETYIGQMPLSVECFFAVGFIGLMGSVPFVLAWLIGESNMTRAHLIESACLVAWLLSAVFVFTNVLKFNSGHWTGARSLTIVEAVYLLSQILTTVGYGDITPAFPRGQVWVAINVILALCLYGSIIMEVTSKLNSKLEQMMRGKGGNEFELSPRSASKLKDWSGLKVRLDYRPLMKSASAFLLAALVGVLFYRLYPGEDKTWLQSIYLSVITLSTVGFGFFNATTEGGKVFGAFWMLFGVATLAATLTNFVDLMTSFKTKEKKEGSEEKLDFFRLTKQMSMKTASGDEGMDDYHFFAFGLVLKGVITEEELAHFEHRFSALGGDATGSVSYKKVFEAERPPAAFEDEAAFWRGATKDSSPESEQTA